VRGNFLRAAMVFVCVLVSTHAFAQSSNATLGGTVSDSTGAFIPGVTIAATNTGTGIVTTTLSNETGAYQFPPLQPGTYKASAELPGFQTQTFNNVTLGISQQVRLNFTLMVGNVATAVEVSVAADTLLATTSASMGVVLPEYKVRDLPLAGRDVIDLISTAPGTRESNFAGAPQGFTMTTRDGIAVNQGRYNAGAFTQTFISPDLVEEVRIIVAPADAEYGRGSGQVQLATRSGTNKYRGSVFWSNRNSFWDAATFNNNFTNVGKDYLNRNQYGGRLDGPIIHNKTFFFFLFEGQRSLQKSVVNAIVLTPTARQGIFRYFPGVPNAGATAQVPTVDLAGNPVRPATGTGDLVPFNVFGRDPLRPGPDQSGLIKKILDGMPMLRRND
jgi:Carboxypeptidase regulatory-like domain